MESSFDNALSIFLPLWNGKSAPDVCGSRRTKRHPSPSETNVPNRVTSRPLAPILALVALAALLTGCIHHDGYPAYYGGYGYYGGIYGGHGGGHHGYGRRDGWYKGDWNRGGGHHGGRHGHGRCHGGHRGHWR
jgi:hypothetical protein